MPHALLPGYMMRQGSIRMSHDPLNIDDCTDAASIRAKLAELKEMGACNFDLHAFILQKLS